MNTKKALLIVSAVALLSCQKDMDIPAPIVDSIQEVALPKIDKESTTLTADDAIKVASLYLHRNIRTKSEVMNSVIGVIPIKSENGDVCIFAVNYDDGYALISATKEFYPILAIIDHGTYTGKGTGTGHDLMVDEYITAIEAAIKGEITIEDDSWSIYEDIPFESPVKTKVSDEYYEVVNQYTGEWYQAGYNIYYLNEKPENMPDDMYAEFCDYASDYDRRDHNYMSCSFIIEDNYTDARFIGSLCETQWGQKLPYNSSLSSPLPLGCTTVAAGQIMNYLQYPTRYQWSSFFRDTDLLYDFLAELRGNIGVSNTGGADIDDVRSTLINDYGFNASNNWSVNKVNHGEGNITLSLDNNIPVYMSGVDQYSNKGHAWVCDGYSYVADYTRYSLFVIPMDDEITWLKEIESREIYRGSTCLFHMNWGWDGDHDGYFQDYYLYFNRDKEGATDFNRNRKDLILDRI